MSMRFDSMLDIDHDDDEIARVRMEREMDALERWPVPVDEETEDFGRKATSRAYRRRDGLASARLARPAP